MNILILGNLISLIGCIFMVLGGLIKERKKILLVQCIQLSFLSIANLILGALSGFISNGVSIFRNLIFTKYQVSFKLKILFILIQIFISIPTLTWQWIEFLPIISTVIYTFFLDSLDEIILKKAGIATLILWAIYDIFYLNLVALFFDVFAIISNIIGIRSINQKPLT